MTKTAKLALHGGPRACDVTWPRWPVWGAAERRALSAVLESGAWWYGRRVAAFERAFADFQGARFGVTAASGSAALEAALLALGIEAGDEVIIPPYTFMATATAVIRVNAIPVFADISPDTLCLDPDDVARKITPRTRVVMPVHLAGHVADMDRLRRLARSRGLKLLEDACHSWGARWRGKGTGALGDAGAFSFQATKNITCAEGGIVLTNDGRLADAVRSYTDCGRRKGGGWYVHAVAGTNMRLTEFQAALLLAQLGRLKRQTLRREAAARFLDERLAGLPGIRLVRTDPRITRRACHLYVLRVDPAGLGISRDIFLEALNAEGAEASAGYVTPLYKMDFFRRGRDGREAAGCRPYAAAGRDYGSVCCPVGEEVCRTAVWFSQNQLLAPRKDLDKLAAAVRKVVGHAGDLRRKAGKAAARGGRPRAGA